VPPTYFQLSVRFYLIPSPLILHPPKILLHPLQLQTQLPTLPPLMPSPNQGSRCRFPANPIHNSQFLPDGQPLFHNRHAPFRADVDSVPLGLQRPSALVPFNSQLHPGIQPFPRSHMLPARLRQTIDPGHFRLLCARQRASQHKHTWSLSSTVSAPFPTVNGTSATVPPTSNFLSFNFFSSSTSRTSFTSLSPPP
jgi:hypothetical protein